MTSVRGREDRLTAGMLLMVLAVTCFTGIDSSAKWLAIAGIPVVQIVFARYIVHFIVVLAIYLPPEGMSAFRSNAPKKQLIRSGALLAGSTLNFIALSYLPITLTITIAFAGPVLVTLLAIPILGEKVGLRRILAVMTGFVGVLITVQPWGVAFHPAVFISLAVLFCSSLYFIMTRMLSGVDSISTMQLWSSGLATVVLLPLALHVWVWPEGLLGWAVLIAIGLFGMAGHICVTIAHRWADASVLAPMVYTQIVSAMLAGILIFNTWPSKWTLAGGAIIIGSGLYIWHRERSKRADT